MRSTVLYPRRFDQFYVVRKLDRTSWTCCTQYLDGNMNLVYKGSISPSPWGT